MRWPWCIKIYNSPRLRPDSCCNNMKSNYCPVMYHVMIVIVLFTNFTILLASQSGIYMDNGVDQTIMHRILDDSERIDVEDEILEFLGLPERPRRKHSHLSLRKSAPQFLLDVYHRLNDEEDDDILMRSKRDTQNHDNFITDLDKQAIDQSDIIMTFLNKNHHVDEVRHEHGRRLWFDVSEVPDDNYLMMAELRLYVKPSEGKEAESGKNFTISVYAIVKIDGERDLELLSSLNTTADYQGWLELNITEGLSKWLADSNDNRGIYISAHEVNRPEHETKLDNIGLIHQRGEEEYQPFMIGFFRGPDLLKSTKNQSSRPKRDTGRVRRIRKSEMNNPLLDPHYGEGVKSCQLQTLYIAFKDLNWQDWIIAPEGYGAYYCSGECNFPLNAHMNATNHAIVQTLVHLLEPKKVPKPCCAPTRLGPLSVLYYVKEENANLKKYKNMIVKSCGCH
ncbi:protein 60A-like [Episyrphus balteatus]|uniref:protein 60A-like n=1 Tax=Episyrphus balteatus TaxID=286459 RepID=UPI00248683D7|nr:protein 60A-like [Episyrphus balteatus]